MFPSVSHQDVEDLHRGIMNAYDFVEACVSAEIALRAVVVRRRVYGPLMAPAVQAQVRTEINVRAASFLRAYASARQSLDHAIISFNANHLVFQPLLPGDLSTHGLTLKQAERAMDGVRDRFHKAFLRDGTLDQIRACETAEVAEDVRPLDPPFSDLLRNELNRAMASIPVKSIADVQVKGVYHSNEFMSVNWYGTEFTFTRNQAACIRVMWSALKQDNSLLPGKTILRKAGIRQGTLERVFHNSFNGERKRHPAFGIMIVSETQDKTLYRLNVREQSHRLDEVLTNGRPDGVMVGRF